MQKISENLATKEDLTAFKYDLRKDIEEMKSDLHKDIGAIAAKIAEVEANKLKWMFLFWIGQVGATLAMLLLFIKK